MKNKICYVLIFILLFLIVISSIAFFNKNNNSKSYTKENNEEKEIIEESEPLVNDDSEKIEIIENSNVDKLFKLLIQYGNTIVEKYDYTTFNKLNDIYFISLNELSELGYDISMFVGEDGTVCNKDTTGIFFDDNSKVFGRESDLIVPCLSQCSKEELN